MSMKCGDRSLRRKRFLAGTFVALCLLIGGNEVCVAAPVSAGVSIDGFEPVADVPVVPTGERGNAAVPPARNVPLGTMRLLERERSRDEYAAIVARMQLRLFRAKTTFEVATLRKSVADGNALRLFAYAQRLRGGAGSVTHDAAARIVPARKQNVALRLAAKAEHNANAAQYEADSADSAVRAARANVKRYRLHVG